MDQTNDSDDYELMSRKEIDKLRKEISVMKKNPYGVSDKGQDLQVSIERLNTTMNKLIAILEDAQQDIIDEYQESKPVEKLNQILDQNETIARALVSINDALKKSSAPQSMQPQNDETYPDFSMPADKPQSPLVNQQSQQMQQPQQYQQFPSQNMQQGMPPMNKPFNPPNQQYNQQYNPQMMNRPQQGMPPMNPQFQQQFPQQPIPQQFQSQQFRQQQFGNIPPLDGLSMDNIPPLEGPPDASALLPEKKKKFLGLI